MTHEISIQPKIYGASIRGVIMKYNILPDDRVTETAIAESCASLRNRGNGGILGKGRKGSNSAAIIIHDVKLKYRGRRKVSRESTPSQPFYARRR